MDKLNLSFSLLVAYVVPGMVGLFAVSLHSPAIAGLIGLDGAQPSAVSIVPVLLLALACGMCINVLSWSALQPLIERSGVTKRKIRYSSLTKDTLDVYREFVDANFRYYQAYVNLAVSLTLLLLAVASSGRDVPTITRVATTVCIGALLVGARDSLRRSYTNMAELLGEESVPMTNGHPMPKPAPPKRGAHPEAIPAEEALLSQSTHAGQRPKQQPAPGLASEAPERRADLANDDDGVGA